MSHNKTISVIAVCGCALSGAHCSCCKGVSGSGSGLLEVLRVP